jgi:UDP-glucose 4-epimerase
MSVSESVLVTGGAGYIGSHVVHALRDRGQRCVVVDDLSFGHREVVPQDVPLIVGDVGDRGLVDGLLREHRVDAVVHLAGAILVAESVVDPLKYYQRNTAAAATLLEACHARGVGRFVFSSTAAVYGAPETVPIPEAAPLAPINPYGRSKLAVEWMLADAAQAGQLRYLALRYFNVAGADKALRTGEWRPKASHLINVACEAALGVRASMTINGTDFPTRDGTCIRDYVHVADLAAAHLAALDHLDRGGDSAAVNCGDGRGTSVAEVVEAVRRVSGVAFAAHAAPRRPGDPPALVADPSQANRLLAWQAKRPLDEMIETALAWERKRRT